MPNSPPGPFDEYERQTGETLQAWSPPQRLAFVAALAERWLQAYEKFSAAEGQGDPAVLRQVVDAVWDHLQGRTLAPMDATRFSAQIDENAPDMEDFDGPRAWRALQACVILGLALECCQKTENTATVVKAALAAFEAAVGDWPADSAGQRRVEKSHGSGGGRQATRLPRGHRPDRTLRRPDHRQLAPRPQAGGAGRTRGPNQAPEQKETR